MHILVVEDPPEWTDMVSRHIAEVGHAVHTCGSWRDALARIQQSPPEILVTAAALPDGSMLEQIAPLRRTFPAMGIVVLTDNAQINSQLQGMSDGADHYLIKPVDLAVLAVTLSALERRLVTHAPRDTAQRGWTLNMQSRQLLSPDGQPLDLTAKEAIVMASLIQSPKFPISHKRMSRVLGYPEVIYDQHRVDALLYRVRKKLATLPGAPMQIRNIYSEGSLLVLRGITVSIAISA